MKPLIALNKSLTPSPDDGASGLFATGGLGVAVGVGSGGGGRGGSGPLN